MTYQLGVSFVGIQQPTHEDKLDLHAGEYVPIWLVFVSMILLVMCFFIGLLGYLIRRWQLKQVYETENIINQAEEANIRWGFDNSS